MAITRRIFAYLWPHGHIVCFFVDRRITKRVHMFHSFRLTSLCDLILTIFVYYFKTLSLLTITVFLKTDALFLHEAGSRSAVGSASYSRARGPGFDTRSDHILSCLLSLIQEGQLSVTDESMCTKYWLTA